MGYTHYWETQTDVTGIQDHPLQVIRQIVDRAYQAGIIQRECDDPEPPIVTSKAIQFNGVGAWGHETFFFSVDKADFQFCKTGAKPYDTVVMQVLIALKHGLGDKIRISSDGDFKKEWQATRRYMEDKYQIRSYVEQYLTTA